MKELVKKILEAGLVDKHTALLFERWRTVDSGAADIVGREDIRKVSVESLVQFAEELAQLIEIERSSFRESKLSLCLKDPTQITWLHSPQPKTSAFHDEMGDFVFAPSHILNLRIGNRFLAGGETWEIEDCSPLHVGNQCCAYLVSATKLDLG